MEWSNKSTAQAEEHAIGDMMEETNDKDHSHTESSNVPGYTGMAAGDAAESDDDQ